MTEPKRLTAYWMKDVIRISEPRTIGKHAWRLVKYHCTENRYVTDEVSGVGRYIEAPAICVDYEWRRLDERFEYWQQARDWPKYDFNDGQYRGLPRTLHKLYDACPWAHPPHPEALAEQPASGDHGQLGASGATR